MKRFAPTEKQKAAVEKLLNKWRPLLFLSEWKIEREWSTRACPDDAAMQTALECQANTTYKSVKITFYPCYFDDHSDWEREQLIVHELCHCLTEITKSLAQCVIVDGKFVTWEQFREANERLTQQFANSIYSLDFYLRRNLQAGQSRRRRKR